MNNSIGYFRINRLYFCCRPYLNSKYKWKYQFSSLLSYREWFKELSFFFLSDHLSETVLNDQQFLWGLSGGATVGGWWGEEGRCTATFIFNVENTLLPTLYYRNISSWVFLLARFLWNFRLSLINNTIIRIKCL